MPRRIDPETAAAIMRQAGVEPIDPYPNSSAPWRCRCLACNHEVTPRLDNVRSGHGACGYCTGTMVDPDAAVAVMLAAGLRPLEPYPGSGRPWRCQCARCRQEVSPRYSAVAKGAGCRHCAIETAGQSIRLDPEAAAELVRAAGLQPLGPYPGAGEPWLCRCATCGRDVTPRYNDVRTGHNGCKRCAQKLAGLGQRIEHETAAAFMLERGLEPLEPYRGAGHQWRCRCLNCGAEVTPRYTNIKQGWGGCLSCGRQAGAHTQRGSEPQAIGDLRAAGLEPLEPYRGVMTPWRSQCQQCGHEVSPMLNNIRRGQGGCAWCAGNRLDPAEAVTLMRAASLEPLIPYPGRSTPWLCRCLRCGETVNPRYGAVRSGTGCRYCNDTAIKPDAAAALMRSAQLEPLEPYPGALRNWRCQCLKCNRIVHPCYSTIQRGSGGCRWCRNSGFKAAEAAVVYLITHADYGAAKVGITDASEGRLKKHSRRGWQVLYRIDVPGELAISIETEILDWWRGELGLPTHLGPEEMPQGGWTETVCAEEIDLALTMHRIRQLTGCSSLTSIPASHPTAAVSALP